MKKTIALISVLAAAVAVADYTPVTVENSVGSSPAFAAATIEGDVTLANDETIDNATDAAVQITFDDDAAVLGTLKLESENSTTNMADGDSLLVDFAAQNDTTQEVTYARIDVNASDVTDTTEDAEVDVYSMVAGSLTKVGSFGSGGYDGELIQNDTIDDDSIDFADVTGADLTLTDCSAITATGALGIGGAATITGAVTVVNASATLNGEKVPVGDDAQSQIIISGVGSVSASHTIVTQTFNTAFANAAVPVVIASYTEDPGDVRPIFVTGIASNQCLFNVTANKAFNWYAIGDR
jgi:hypothetical protein